MSFTFKVNGVAKDPDAVFKARGGSTARANIPVFKGTDPATAQNWSDRYYAATGGDTVSGSSNLKIRVGGSHVDALTLFRDINYTPPPPPPPSTSLSGPSTAYNGATYNFSASTSASLTFVRFQIQGYSAGNWSPASGSSYSGSWSWTGSPGSGDWLFYFEAMDNFQQVGRSEMWVHIP